MEKIILEPRKSSGRRKGRKVVLTKNFIVWSNRFTFIKVFLFHDVLGSLNIFPYVEGDIYNNKTCRCVSSFLYVHTYMYAYISICIYKHICIKKKVLLDRTIIRVKRLSGVVQYLNPNGTRLMNQGCTLYC